MHIITHMNNILLLVQRQAKQAQDYEHDTVTSCGLSVFDLEKRYVLNEQMNELVIILPTPLVMLQTQALIIAQHHLVHASAHRQSSVSAQARHFVNTLDVTADTSEGTSYGPKYYKTWLPRGLPNITNVDILAHQKPENDAANDPEACSRLYDQTLHIIRKRVGEIEAEQKGHKGGVSKKPEE